MDIEHLSKAQLVMLALLVSFMTSLSTGIVTVALMQQAPPSITQSVSKIVERTIEKVVPGQTAAVAPTVKTVVIKEASTVSEAVETAAPSVVRLFVGERAEPSAIGLVISAKGLVASDASALAGFTVADLETRSGGRIAMTVGEKNDAGIVYLSPATSTEYTWVPIKISGSHTLLGQSIFSLSGKTALRVNPGIITAFSTSLLLPKNSNIQVLETSLTQDVVVPGSPIFDLNGSVVGISTSISRHVAATEFESAEAILYSEVKETATTTQ